MNLGYNKIQKALTYKSGKPRSPRRQRKEKHFGPRHQDWESEADEETKQTELQDSPTTNKDSSDGKRVPISGPEVPDDESPDLHAEAKKRKMKKKERKESYHNWSTHEEYEVVQSEYLRGALFDEPRAETDTTRNLKCQIGGYYVHTHGREYLESGELPRLAAKAITELVTKKCHLLGVGKGRNGLSWE